jgi:hypothetical protein
MATWEDRAELGDCHYCLARKVPVVVEPFGNKPACWTDWQSICLGEDDE